MKVKELIEELLKLDQDAHIVVETDYGLCEVEGVEIYPFICKGDYKVYCILY